MAALVPAQRIVEGVPAQKIVEGTEIVQMTKLELMAAMDLGYNYPELSPPFFIDRFVAEIAREQIERRAKELQAAGS